MLLKVTSGTNVGACSKIRVGTPAQWSVDPVKHEDEDSYLAAIFGPTTTSAFRKLTRKLLPLAALIVGTLANPTPSIVLATQVAHHYTRPVLHILGVTAHCKLLNQRENIVVVRLKELFVLIFIRFSQRKATGGRAVYLFNFAVDA